MFVEKYTKCIMVARMAKTASIICFFILCDWVNFPVGTLTHLKTTWPVLFSVNNNFVVVLLHSQVACEMHDRLLVGLTKLEQFQVRELIRKMNFEKVDLGG